MLTSRELTILDNLTRTIGRVDHAIAEHAKAGRIDDRRRGELESWADRVALAAMGQSSARYPDVEFVADCVRDLFLEVAAIGR